MLQLHIELKVLKPKVWRRVLVPETITLAKLHLVIHRAFQWGGHHLHEFDAGGQRYGSPDPDFDPRGGVSSERTRLTSAMDFVQAMADPTHEEHEHLKAWIGRDSWDATAFDLHEVNSYLAEIKL